MGNEMKFLKETVAAAKSMPKPVFVAAVILPFGFTALGIYLAAKTTIQVIKNKKEHK
jgi:hypothetical protein